MVKFQWVLTVFLLSGCNSLNSTHIEIYQQAMEAKSSNSGGGVCPVFVMPPLEEVPVLPKKELLQYAKEGDVKKHDETVYSHIEKLRIHSRKVEKDISVAYEKYLEDCAAYQAKNYRKSR